ncbi:hypothetical protein [Brevundimonas sp. AAP58]|uniref:hypothetical protein n=1 Tax=Brevundimonas sp. AAP58 TaxID=1523422 RepID=UPI0006B8E727|nr:hypothetical protein [Brevundimonas sp. AAP58]
MVTPPVEGAGVGPVAGGRVVSGPVGAVTGLVGGVATVDARGGVAVVTGSVVERTAGDEVGGLFVAGAVGRAPPVGGVAVAEGRAITGPLAELDPAADGVTGPAGGAVVAGTVPAVEVRAGGVVVTGRSAAGGAPFSMRVRSLAVLCWG